MTEASFTATQIEAINELDPFDEIEREWKLAIREMGQLVADHYMCEKLAKLWNLSLPRPATYEAMKPQEMYTNVVDRYPNQDKEEVRSLAKQCLLTLTLLHSLIHEGGMDPKAAYEMVAEQHDITTRAVAARCRFILDKSQTTEKQST